MNAFEPGDLVRTRIENPPSHTRLPGYLRGRPGRVERFAGEHRGTAIYTVAFDAHDVWGADAPAHVTIYADLFEIYLEKRS